MDDKKFTDGPNLEAGLPQGNGSPSRSSQMEQASFDLSPSEYEQEIRAEDHPRDQTLLGATLRANVFNPEFLPALSGLQGASADDGDIEPEHFPTLLSASMRSNVFNPDFLNLAVEKHVEDHVEAHIQARGLERHSSLARRVISRAPGFIDDAVGRAVDEELGMSDARHAQDTFMEPKAAASTEAEVIDLTSNGQTPSLNHVQSEHRRKKSETDARPVEKLPPLKRLWRLFLQPHSPLASQLEALFVLVLLSGVLLCGLWLAIGHAAAPDGPIFSLVIVYLAAVVFGELAARVGTHPLVGMLIAGFICRYIPGVKAGHVIPPEVSAFIRELGLCTILLRAGIALDIKLLMRLKWLSFACSLFPTVVEAAVLAAMSVWLLSLPWTWAFMSGFIVAGVAPAIVVPALLSLQDEGYGVAKGIPSLVLAVAAVDDCLSVIGNAVFNNIIFQHSEIVMSIFRAPIEIAMGIAVGGGLGLGAILLLPRSHPPETSHVLAHQASASKRGGTQVRQNSGGRKESTHQHTGVGHTQQRRPDPQPGSDGTAAVSDAGSEESGPTKMLKAIKDKMDPQKMLPHVPAGDGAKMALMRTAYVLGFGLWCILGGQKLKYSGAGALAVVILGAVAGQGWGRELSSKPKLFLLYTWALLAQPLLFGVIGSQIDVSYFKGSFLWRGVIVLPVAALARCLVTVGSTVGTVLNTSERLFIALAWLPKATVQAALAPQALSQVKGKHDPKLTGYAQTVFALGMLSVILTAPLGAMILKLSGPRLLVKVTDRRPDQVVHAE